MDRFAVKEIQKKRQWNPCLHMYTTDSIGDCIKASDNGAIIVTLPTGTIIETREQLAEVFNG